MFSPQASNYLKNMEALMRNRTYPRYVFCDTTRYSQIIKSNLSEGMRIYWYEMLMRCHLTAFTSILRHWGWIRAMQTAQRDSNTLAFASAFRGLMESVGDSFTSISLVPLTLARDFDYISDALALRSGKGNLFCKELEDSLIHYSHARKPAKEEGIHPMHSARPIQQYLEILEKADVTRLKECYAALCDITHPAASSVWMWMISHSDSESQISPNREAGVISRMLDEFHETCSDLVIYGFNGPIIILAILNYFNVPDLHTPELLRWNLNSLPLWMKIRSALIGRPVLAKLP